MRFRCKINENTLSQTLARTASIVTRQTAEITIRLTRTHMYFISTGESVLETMRLWLEIPVNPFFDPYVMDGVSEIDNEIFMTLSSDLLSKTLKTIGSNAQSVKLKLTRDSFLQISIEQDKVGRGMVHVVHDIPVKIVSRRYWDNFEEIPPPNADISFYLPRSLVFKNSLEKMKCLSKTLELRVESGSLKIKSCNLVSENEMIYTNVEVLEETANNDSPAISVDAKRLAKFIACLNISPNVPVLAKLVPNQMLHLSFVQEQILVYFVLPSVEE